MVMLDFALILTLLVINGLVLLMQTVMIQRGQMLVSEAERNEWRKRFPRTAVVVWKWQIFLQVIGCLVSIAALLERVVTKEMGTAIGWAAVLLLQILAFYVMVRRATVRPET